MNGTPSASDSAFAAAIPTSSRADRHGHRLDVAHPYARVDQRLGDQRVDVFDVGPGCHLRHHAAELLV